MSTPTKSPALKKCKSDDGMELFQDGGGSQAGDKRMEAMMDRLLSKALEANDQSWEKRLPSILSSYETKVDAKIQASEKRTLEKFGVLENHYGRLACLRELFVVPGFVLFGGTWGAFATSSRWPFVYKVKYAVRSVQSVRTGLL